jgi:hypothetical protein
MAFIHAALGLGGDLARSRGAGRPRAGARLLLVPAGNLWVAALVRSPASATPDQPGHDRWWEN